MRFNLLLCAVLLDLLLGDPHWMPHPVRWMGRCVSALEKALRRIFPNRPRGELAAGAVLAALVVALFSLGSWGLVVLCRRLSPWLSAAAQVWFCYQLLAARSLQRESMAVYPPLRGGDLPRARELVGRIVGRDTQGLDKAGIARAAVETVAENTSDGVLAPLFWMLIGGLPLGMAYKAINTMDSMVGYRNDRYLYFGRAAARLDDAANFIPARLSGGLICLGAALLPGFDGRSAFAVFFRDRKKHSSPNSAHTEAACAGALGIQLGGYALYSGKLVSKPTLGDDLRPIEPEDIPRAVQLMYATLALTILGALAAHLVVLRFQ